MRGGGVRIATASVRTGFAMTSFFARSAIQVRAGRPGGRPLRMRNKRRNGRATARVAPTKAYLAVRRGGALPLPRAGKSAKRCQWQRKRVGFEEVPRLADTTVTGNRLARRWAREPRPYESVTRGAAKRADVGSELSAAGGRGSEVSEWPRSKF